MSRTIDKVIIAIILTLFGVLLFLLFRVDEKNKVRTIINWNEPKFIGKRSGKTFAVFGKHNIETPLPDDTLELFAKEEEERKELYKRVRSPQEILDEFGISFKEGTLSDLAIEVNTKIFDVSSSYFLTSYNGIQLSPIIPLAIANVETPGRADLNINYSAILPSKYITVESADAVDTMSSIAVLEDSRIFNALASDHWTRDRGPFQMNPNYGIVYDSFTSLMGDSEREVLANWSSIRDDWSGYSAYEPRHGRTLGVEDWIAELSAQPGDRHSIKDALLRIGAAFQQAVDQYSSQYSIDNEYQMLLVCALYHGNSSIWNPAYASRKTGRWHTGSKARELLLSMTNEEYVAIIQDFVKQKLEEYRSAGRPIPIYCEREWAQQLYDIGVDRGYFYNYDYYIDESQYYFITYQYPVQVMYSYILLNTLYTGG